MATIPMSDVLDWSPLPIDAQDIVTRVHLLISGRAAGGTPANTETSTFDLDDNTISNKMVFSHSFTPVVHTFTAAEHTTHASERLVDLPEGTNPFIPPQDLALDDPEEDFSTPIEEVRDGDPETYWETDVSTRVQLWWQQSAAVVGWRLMYAFDRDDTSLVGALPTYWRAGVWLRHESRDSGATKGVAVVRQWAVLGTESLEQLNELWATASFDARSLTVTRPDQTVRAATLGLPVGGSGMTGTLRVYHFYPLVLDAVALDEVARSFVRLPAALPRRVTIKGYIAPAREHTITGWPGGDYTGTVAQVQYELGRTVIDFEQAAAPVGLPFEAVEVERARSLRTDDAVREGMYKFSMGG